MELEVKQMFNQEQGYSLACFWEKTKEIIGSKSMGHSNGTEEIYAKMKLFCRDFADVFIHFRQYLGNTKQKIMFQISYCSLFPPSFLVSAWFSSRGLCRAN